MGYVEKRGRRYRARYRDPLGRLTSKSFTRKADAERFVREMEVDLDRGAWLDPRAGEMTLAEWVDEFLALARRLSPTTLQTYRRDLNKYVLPRFGAYRIARLPADEIENWLNDESRRRHSAKLRAPPLPHLASRPSGRGREAEDPFQPVRPGPAATCPYAGHDLSVLERDGGSRRGPS